MGTRRYFIKKFLLVFCFGGALWWLPFKGLQRAWAKAKKIVLPKDTPPQSLILKNPADLDTRNLELTELEEFGTMGISDLEIDVSAWRLEITGEVAAPMQLTFQDILASPQVEKNVLLICPGVFVNHGRWRGVTVRSLLEKAGWNKKASHVTVHGPKSSYEKVESFEIEDILSEKIFLAHQVNAKPLPAKHGFPLRLVAEDHYGYQWVKYVYRITVKL